MTTTNVALPQMALGDSHRLFLQSMMGRGAVSEAEAKDLYLKATRNCGGELFYLLIPYHASVVSWARHSERSECLKHETGLCALSWHAVC